MRPSFSLNRLSLYASNRPRDNQYNYVVYPVGRLWRFYWRSDGRNCPMNSQRQKPKWKITVTTQTIEVLPSSVIVGNVPCRQLTIACQLGESIFHISTFFIPFTFFFIESMLPNPKRRDWRTERCFQFVCSLTYKVVWSRSDYVQQQAVSLSERRSCQTLDASQPAVIVCWPPNKVTQACGLSKQGHSVCSCPIGAQDVSFKTEFGASGRLEGSSVDVNDSKLVVGRLGMQSVQLGRSCWTVILFRHLRYCTRWRWPRWWWIRSRRTHRVIELGQGTDSSTSRGCWSVITAGLPIWRRTV